MRGASQSLHDVHPLAVGGHGVPKRCGGDPERGERGGHGVVCAPRAGPRVVDLDRRGVVLVRATGDDKAAADKGGDRVGPIYGGGARVVPREMKRVGREGKPPPVEQRGVRRQEEEGPRPQNCAQPVGPSSRSIQTRERGS